MIPTSLSDCDCCGLPITTVTTDDCPRCGYPITAAKEEQFLASSLLSLDRVATFGGANITVTQLIERYRRRLSYLQKAKTLRAELSSQKTPGLKLLRSIHHPQSTQVGIPASLSAETADAACVRTAK